MHCCVSLFGLCFFTLDDAHSSSDIASGLAKLERVQNA